MDQLSSAAMDHVPPLYGEAVDDIPEFVKTEAIRCRQKSQRATEEVALLQDEIRKACIGLLVDIAAIQKLLAAPALGNRNQLQLHAGRSCRLATELSRLRRQLQLLESLSKTPLSSISILKVRNSESAPVVHGDPNPTDEESHFALESDDIESEDQFDSEDLDASSSDTSCDSSSSDDDTGVG